MQEGLQDGVQDGLQEEFNYEGSNTEDEHLISITKEQASEWVHINEPALLALIEKIKEIAKKTPELQISDKVEEKPIEELESFLTLIECNSDFLKTSKSEPEPKKEVQQKQQSNAEKVQPQIKDNVKMPPKNENENDSFDKLNSSFVKRTQLLKSKK